MSISDINNKIIKTVKIYIFITIFCFIFSYVYLKFSFGVVSYYMKYLSLIPLILGVITYLIIWKMKIKYNRISYNLYNAGIFTIIVGSAVRGILDICGGHSFYTPIYLVIGVILIIISFLKLIIVNGENHGSK